MPENITIFDLKAEVTAAVAAAFAKVRADFDKHSEGLGADFAKNLESFKKRVDKFQQGLDAHGNEIQGLVKFNKDSTISSKQQDLVAARNKERNSIEGMELKCSIVGGSVVRKGVSVEVNFLNAFDVETQGLPADKAVLSPIYDKLYNKFFYNGLKGSIARDSNVVLEQKDLVGAKNMEEKKVSDASTDTGPIVDSFSVQSEKKQVVMVISKSYDVDARIAASRAKAAAFASFLKNEREKNKSRLKFIRGNIEHIRVQSKGDSTLATNLGDNPREVENGGVGQYYDKDSSPASNLGDNPREVENGGVEHYSDKDSSPAYNLGDHPREVENDGVEHYSVKDSSPAPNPGVMTSKVEMKSVELYSEKDSTPVSSLGVIPNGLTFGSKGHTEKDSTPAPISGIMPCKVEEISVELCSKGDSIPALREDSLHLTMLNVRPIKVELCSDRDSIPASPTNLGVMAIKTDSEKMVAPSNNEYKFIYPQK